MSHEDVALVWSVLYGREDINSILVEAIGSHSLEVSVYRGDPERLRKVIDHHILNLKVIYDLQRTFLQSSPRKSKTLLSLLRREVLFSSIIHLLDVTAVAFSLPNGSPSLVGGTLYAQTLLSALRALSLQDGVMKGDELDLLDRRFEETFKKRHLDDLNSFTINSVCRKMIKDLFQGREPRDISTPACGVTTLPDFFGEPYVLELNSERTTGAIRRALLTPPAAPGWLRGVLVLYDIVWSTTAALIRLCMITEERKRNGQWSSSDEGPRLNDLQFLLSARFQVQNLIFNTRRPAYFNEDEHWAEEQLKVLILSGLRLTCILDQCQCLGKDSASIEMLRSRHGGKQTMTQMSMVASASQSPPEHDLALKEIASVLDQRILKTGKERHEIGGGTVDTCSKITIPNTQPDTSQASIPWTRRRAETSPKLPSSTPFSNELFVRKKPSFQMAPISRSAYSEERRVAPAVNSLLKPGHNQVYPSRVEEDLSHQASSPATVFEQPQRQLSQTPQRAGLCEELPPLAIESKPMSQPQQVEHSAVPFTYPSSTIERTQTPASLRATFASKTTTPMLASDESQSAPLLSRNVSTPFSEDTLMTLEPVQPPSSRERQNEVQPVAIGSLTLERKPISPSPSHEKTWVDPSKDVKTDEWRVPDIDFNTLLDLKRPNLVTEEGKPSFVAPSYDEVLSLDQERTDSTGTRSPAMTSEGISPLPQTPHIEREDYPELAPVQNNQIDRPVPRRINTVDPNSFPEPLNTLQVQNRPGTGAASVVSDESEPSRFVGSASSKSKKWGGLFKSSRTAATSIPHSIFCASGKSLILWNELGAGCYDLHNADSIQFRRINAREIRLAAGGTTQFAVVTKIGTGYRLEVYEGACDALTRDWRLDSLPSAIAVSRNDQYIALKFSRCVLIYEVTTGSTFYHELPAQSGRSGRGNHLVAFATDSLSFTASTRYEPEKIITYWSECTNNSKAKSVGSSAPFGLVGDDGLSSLVCSNTSSRSAYLTTFTEKGPPVLLNCSLARPVGRLLRDNNGVIGSRVHRAAGCAAGTSLVLLNQRNDIFWVFDCFGPNLDVRRIGSVKRPVSVKRDAEIGMPNSDEVYVFWIDRGKGHLVTMGRGGGKSKPVELTIDMELLVA